MKKETFLHALSWLLFWSCGSNGDSFHRSDLPFLVDVSNLRDTTIYFEPRDEWVGNKIFTMENVTDSMIIYPVNEWGCVYINTYELKYADESKNTSSISNPLGFSKMDTIFQHSKKDIRFFDYPGITGIKFQFHYILRGVDSRECWDWIELKYP